MPQAGSRRTELLDTLERVIREVSAQSIVFSHAMAERVGINSTDMECLDIVNIRRPVTAGQLADATGLTTGAITGVVDRLEKAGYVRRERDPHDRRRVLIEPTAAVDRDIAPMFDSCHDRMSELWSSYSDADLTLILDFLARSSEVMRAEIAKLRESEEALPLSESVA